MIKYRSFRNDDPPALAAIWRRQGGRRALAQPMTTELLERHVFSKPYFDHDGFIVAEGEEGVLGFAHAAFGANEDRSDIDPKVGILCLVMVDQGPEQNEIAQALLTRCECYLKEKGAEVLHAGQYYPRDPFYRGLMGGSDMSGIPVSDEGDLSLFQSAGYHPADEIAMLQLELSQFRAPIDRAQLLVGRQCTLSREEDPAANDWWEACTWGEAFRSRYALCRKEEESPFASVMYWDIEPLSANWGVHAMGVSRLQVFADSRRSGCATYLMGQSLKQLQQEGVSLVEAHISLGNTSGLALFKKLGFHEVDRGILLRKDV